MFLVVLSLVVSGARSMHIAGAPQAAVVPQHMQLARDIFKELIEINTTDSSGSTTEAAEAMEARLKAAGFPSADVQVLGPNSRKGNLVRVSAGPEAASLSCFSHILT